MAIDTRPKRQSVVGVAAPSRVFYPVATGVGMSAVDRQHAAFCYRGIAAAEPSIPVALLACTFLDAGRATQLVDGGASTQARDGGRATLLTHRLPD